MARINFEQKIYSDIRFVELVQRLGEIDTAIGALIRVWTLAQEFYLNTETERMIPKLEWGKHRMKDEVIAVGLAEVRGDLIYVKGSEKHFSWLIKCQEKGRIGGLANNRSSKGTLSNPKGNKSSSSSSLSKKEENTVLQTRFNEAKEAYQLATAISVTGAQAEKRFAVQIRDQSEHELFMNAIRNYGAMLQQENWRSPKQSFEAFIGTNGAGAFWKAWINIPLGSSSEAPDPLRFVIR